MEDKYVLDADGNRVYAGDYVQCAVDYYVSLRRGDRRRVVLIEDGRIILRNSTSPASHGTSQYRPTNFQLAGRHHPWHKTGKEPMPRIYVAYQIEEGQDYDKLAEKIVSGSIGAVAAYSDYNSLKNRVEKMIRNDPSLRVIILNGTTIGEISSPPVRFRDA